MHKMRQKDAHQKARFAFIVAMSATLLIAGIWMLTIPVRLASTANQASLVADKDTVDDFINTTRSNVSDIVRTAEILKNQGLAGSAFEASTTPTAVPQGPSEVEEYVVPQVIPRRVLIATTTDEMPE